MDQTEKQVIDGLFDRLKQAERASAHRDADAERHIGSLVSQQPAAPYYMAQAIVVQEHALKAAQERISQLEQELEEQPAQASGGGFLGGLFGGGSPAPARGSVPRAGGMRYPAPNARAAAENSPVAQYQRTGQGGGFLAGAMQTAVGVAGGMVVANMLTGMFSGGNEAQAADSGVQPVEPQPAAAEQQPEPELQDASNDSGGWFGGWGDDGGDMDI
jgi:hypothetical protein